MFVVCNAKKITAVLIVLIVLQLALTLYLCATRLPSADTSLIDFTVVIDAGHGGIDGGVVGSDGVKESALNLQYAKQLGEIFQLGGFNVVYTRKTDGGLYGLATKGFKLRDMQARKQIIENARPNIVISVHMNKFAQSSRTGPQVFYQSGRQDGKLLADNLQQVFNDFTGNSHQAIGGDFYVCREISNPQECALLQTPEYRKQICNYIYNGVMLYLYST